ncbi:MAG: hypothetical protein M3033_16135 [Acidobacteriota bacterium]|nr:hypothetical protein [Acidobacteriota bacterium]
MPRSVFFVICFSLMLFFPVSAQTDSYLKKYQERIEKNLKDVDFTIKFKNDQTKFRQGEIIPVELRFSTSTENRYNFLNRAYDRSGRLYLDGFVIDKEEKTFDPLYDYFNRSGMLTGGGLYSVPTLTSTPQIINYELNDYLSFKEVGKYRIYIASPRVSLKTEKKDGVTNAMFGDGIALTSNILEFEILPADEKWQAEKFAEGVKNNCSILRYLGTKAAAKEMLIRFSRGDKSCEFDNYIGLFGSPERGFIVSEMEQMLISPDYAVTDDFFQVLLRLRYFLNNPKTEKDETSSFGFENKKEKEKKNLIKLDYLEKFLRALPDKSKAAFQTSLETYFGFHADGEKEPPVELTAALVNNFGNLSKKTQWMILQNSLDKLKTQAMLPVLQTIYNSIEKTDPDSSDFFYDKDLLNQSIKGIYALDRNTGKQIILSEIRRPKQKVYTSVLTLLPKSESPEVENILLEKLNAGNIPADELNSVFLLVDYYETPKLISKLREIYVDKIDKAECGAQIEFLKIFLKSDIKFGEEKLDKVVKNDTEKGCIGANLANVIQPHWSSEIERIVSSLLENNNLFISGNAADLLGKYGSAGVKDKIWKRFERFNKEEPGKKDSTEKKRDFSNWQLSLSESTFVSALSESPNWFFDQESNKRASKLCLYDFCKEITEKLNKIFSQPAKIETSLDEENQILFSVNQYKKLSLDALKKKLEQFPPETTFIWISNSKNSNEAKNFQAIKEFVEARQMKLKSNN